MDPDKKLLFSLIAKPFHHFSIYLKSLFTPSNLFQLKLVLPLHIFSIKSSHVAHPSKLICHTINNPLAQFCKLHFIRHSGDLCEQHFMQHHGCSVMNLLPLFSILFSPLLIKRETFHHAVKVFQL
jgi:hypothetical protein